jgi:hypothetical protein
MSVRSEYDNKIVVKSSALMDAEAAMVAAAHQGSFRIAPASEKISKIKNFIFVNVLYSTPSWTVKECVKDPQRLPSSNQPTYINITVKYHCDIIDGVK